MTDVNRPLDGTGKTEDIWPALPLEAWQETCETLHRWTQIVGKIRLKRAPMTNHWWQVSLSVTSRGLTTSPMPYGSRAFQIDFDFITHELLVTTDSGDTRSLALKPRSVADFYGETISVLKSLGLTVDIWTTPVEIAGAHPLRAGPCARILRSRLRAPVLEGSRADRPRAEGLSRPLHRQGKPRAILLGQLRHGGNPFLGATRPGAPRRAECKPFRNGGSLLARGQQLRILARNRLGETGILRLRLPRTERVQGTSGSTGGGLLQRGFRRVRPPVRRRADGSIARCETALLPRKHL